MIQTWLWLHCLRICSWLLPANAWSYSKPCSSFVLGCLQNFSHIQFMRGSKWAPYFRRKKLSLQYCLKLSCNYNNPPYATVFNSKFHSVFERKPTQLSPLAVHVSGDLQAVGFKKSDVITRNQPNSRFHGRDIIREIGLLPWKMPISVKSVVFREF